MALSARARASLGQWTHPETQLQVLIASALTEYWHSGWEVGHSVLTTSDRSSVSVGIASMGKFGTDT